MLTVWKFQIPKAPEEFGAFPLRVPSGARFLHAGIQQNRLTLWAEVHSENPPVDIRVAVVGTGTDCSHLERVPRQFLGAVFQGPFVWHIWLCDSGPLAMMTPDQGAIRK